MFYFWGRIVASKDKEILSKSFLKLAFSIKFSGSILIALNLIWGLRFHSRDVLKPAETKSTGWQDRLVL